MAREVIVDGVPLSTCWKVRVVLHGAVLHVLSKSEPVVLFDNGHLAGVQMDLVRRTGRGDDVGYIDWSAVVAVTWRTAAWDSSWGRAREDY